MRVLIMLPTTISESFLKSGTTDRLGCIVVQINTGLLDRTIVIDPVIEPLTYPFEVHIPIVIIYIHVGACGQCKVYPYAPCIYDLKENDLKRTWA